MELIQDFMLSTVKNHYLCGFLGQTNQNCNEVCSAKGGDLKCLSGNWKMSKDEYKQALHDGGLKDEDSVNTVEDVETWCGKIGGSTGLLDLELETSYK